MIFLPLDVYIHTTGSKVLAEEQHPRLAVSPLNILKKRVHRSGVCNKDQLILQDCYRIRAV